MNKFSLGQFAAGFELILAAAFWGFGFIAVVWALPAWNPVQQTFLRFTLGATAGIAICILRARPSKAELKWTVLVSLVPSACMFLTIVVQTWSLRYTTATKSAFITILYVVLIPIVESLWRRKPIPKLLWLCVGISLAGVYMVAKPDWNQGWNKGDLLNVLVAALATTQILAIDRVSGKIEKAFLFNTLQSCWCVLMAALLLPVQDGSLFGVTPSAHAVIGIMSLGLGSTMIAFFLQVRAQKVLSPTVSSLLFLMESPFAMLFASILLSEKLDSLQTGGAGLIFFSAALATVRGSKR